MTPAGARIRNPAFDVTPAKFVTAIVTERGIAMPPYADSLAALALGGTGQADDRPRD
jgi:methylthioribose-1-phosphate isomerase